MLLATTLLDAKRYPAADVAALYCQRWEIELRFRDLKTTMGMECLRAKTPEMALKELCMFALAYNVLRLVMLRAALEHGTDPWRLSFKGAIQVVAAWSGRADGLRGKPRLRSAAFSQLLEQIAQRQVPHRPFRWEPRVVKRRPKPFPRMTRPRREYHEDHNWNKNLSLIALAS